MSGGKLVFAQLMDHLPVHTLRRTLPAAAICALDKSRWQVEQFFQWIK